MKTIRCPKCGSDFYWNETDSAAKCVRCGTVYKMHPQVQPVLMPQVGRGVTDLLTVPDDRTVAGRPIIKTYIPKNWRYQCGIRMDRFDLVSNPMVAGVEFASPDNSAHISFVGESFYKHFQPDRMTAHLQGRLDDFTVSRSPSFFRLKTRMNASEYCDSLILNMCQGRIAVINEKAPDSSELSKQQDTVSKLLSNGFLDAAASWAGKTYRINSPDGRVLNAYAESRVIQLLKSTVVPAVQMMQQPFGFGMRMMPQMVNQERRDIFWDTQYEYVLIAESSVFERAMEELEKIKKTLDYLPGMYEARDAALQLANNTVMGIAQTNSDSMRRRSQIIADKDSYISGVQQQMFADNAASHDRIANRNSEMLREVNTYYGSDRIVEASTGYDHVYQNIRNPDIFAAQEGSGFEFGVDFEELKKTDGDY